MNRILGHTLLLLGMVLLLGGAAQASGIRINFLAEAEVAGERIRIGDLAASVSGDDQAAVERIKETVVGPSPAPGRSVRITSRRINELLSFGNLGQDKLQARIPPQINVRRGSTEVTRQMMEQAFQEAVEDSLPFVPDQVEIVDVRTPKDLTLPPGELEIVTQLKGASRIPGRVTANLDFLINGVLAESKRVTGLVKFFQGTVVAARPISRGKIIDKDDLSLIRRRMRGSEMKYFENPEQVEGMVAEQAILAGQPIKPNQIAQPILVKRGDRVTLVAEKGRLSVTANGVIKDQKGALGDQVKVLNLTTKREVYGRLVNANTVKVTF